MDYKIKNYKKVALTFLFLWFLSCISFILILGLATSFFRTTVDKTSFGDSNLFLYSLLLFMFFGVVFFLLALIFFGINKAKEKSKSGKKRRKLKSILVFTFYPFIELKDTFKKDSKASIFKRLAKSFVIIVFLIPFWTSIYLTPFIITGGYAGLIMLPGVNAIGHSMEPSILNGESTNTYPSTSLSLKLRKPQRKDIITFETGNSINTEGMLVTYVKRIIAIPGDTIQIKDGFVYLNNQLIEEPYIKNARSTFGSSFLKECESIKVPNGYVFAMGDNRKRSKDSREIGFIAYEDIKGILPFSKQIKYQDRWRDSSKDSQQAGLPTLDKDKYYEELNKIRVENNLKPLKKNELLEKAAQKRIEVITINEPINKNPNTATYGPKEALRDVGYYNIVTGESNTYGYYSEEELVKHWMDQDIKNQILNKEYQEIGLALEVNKIGGCEKQIIVQLYGGWIPPSYKQSDIEGWETTLNQLRNILPSWENIRNSKIYSDNKDKAERIIEIINLRIFRIEKIANRMRTNQWLTNEEINYTKEDKALYDEQVSLANYLNSLTW